MVGPTFANALTLATAAGTHGVPYDVPVERGKVREFAAATKTHHSFYRDDAVTAVPPTFLATSAFWTQPGSAVLELLPLDWNRLLSGGTEFVFYGPPLRIGETLRAQQRVEDVFTKQGRRSGTMTFIVYSVEFRRADGSIAARERHTTISTSRAAASSDARKPVAGNSACSPVESRPTAVHSASLAVGAALPEFTDAPVSRTGIVRYQGASGDFNPIHHDDEFARQAGYPGAFSVGMYHAGILGTYLADLFSPEAVRKFKVEFREQVWPGDILTYRGTVRDRSARAVGEGQQLDLELTAAITRGGTHLRATATVEV